MTAPNASLLTAKTREAMLPGMRQEPDTELPIPSQPNEALQLHLNQPNSQTATELVCDGD